MLPVDRRGLSGTKRTLKRSDIMKKFLIAICFVCLFATSSFAGDIIIAPNISKPAPGEMDIYVVRKDNGRTKTVVVIDIDEDSFVAVDSEGKSTYIMKIND